MSDRFFKKNALLVELILNVTSGVNIGKKWRKTFLESLIIYLAVFLLSRVFLAAAILAVAQEVPITTTIGTFYINKNNNSSNSSKIITYDKMISVVRFEKKTELNLIHKLALFWSRLI